MSSLQAICVVLVALAGGCARAVVAADEQELPPQSTGALELVSPSALCVTSGRLATASDGMLTVDVGTMRAVVAGNRSRAAELSFTYPGPSAVDVPLADGELRRQIGLKLRAQDGCNVVYAMWHIEPTPGISVSMKSNPGVSSTDDCGDSGYVNVQPVAGTRPPPIKAGEPHVLRADLDGDELTVLADGKVAWKGHLPAESLTFDGPAGVRSDNGRFDFELKVAGGARANARCDAGQLVSNAH